MWVLTATFLVGLSNFASTPAKLYSKLPGPKTCTLEVSVNEVVFRHLVHLGRDYLVDLVRRTGKGDRILDEFVTVLRVVPLLKKEHLLETAIEWRPTGKGGRYLPAPPKMASTKATISEGRVCLDVELIIERIDNSANPPLIRYIVAGDIGAPDLQFGFFEQGQARVRYAERVRFHSFTNHDGTD